MAEVKLTSAKGEVLRSVLRTIAIQRRTGALGIVHGMNRFVSTKLILRKQERELLDSIARKFGLSGITQLD